LNASLGSASLDVLGQVGAEPLAGKPLIDIALAVTSEMELAYPTPVSRRRARRPSEAKVVKTLSTVPAALMTNAEALGGPSTVFLSGDDPEAKQTVGALLTDLGWAKAYQLDLGDITTARGPDHLVPLLLGVYGALVPPPRPSTSSAHGPVTLTERFARPRRGVARRAAYQRHCCLKSSTRADDPATSDPYNNAGQHRSAQGRSDGA
jgi:hypothetical protein